MVAQISQKGPGAKVGRIQYDVSRRPRRAEVLSPTPPGNSAKSGRPCKTMPDSNAAGRLLRVTESDFDAVLM